LQREDESSIVRLVNESELVGEPSDISSRGRDRTTGGREVTLPRVARTLGRFVRDWLPVLFVLFAYDAVHNRIGLIQPVHTRPQLLLEQALFGLPVPTVRMQAAFYSPERPSWWDFATLAVYMSHFFVTLAIALVLWMRSRARYFRFMAWFVFMTTLGYVTYIVFPAVPPWLASQRGELVATHRIVRELWDYLGYHGIARTFSGASVLANDVAAIPSLHAAYTVMIAAFFWERNGFVARAGLALYAAAMAVALVYAAEHFVVDIVLGWLYAAVTGSLMWRLWPADSNRDRDVAVAPTRSR
jgi:membrane-associated phospholipid phosphatase